MHLKTKFTAKHGYFLQLALYFFWISNLAHSDSYVIVYILTGLIGLCCLRKNYVNQSSVSGWRAVVMALFSAVFSLSAVLANHQLFWGAWVTSLLMFLGGLSLGWNILLYGCTRFPLEPADTEDRSKTRPAAVFFRVFLPIVILDLCYLFFVEYPGNITPDSLWQLRQTISGEYHNWHPYWHTVVIEFWVDLGMALFGNLNDAVAVYSVWQILFLASCFSYAIVTLYQAGIPKKWLLCAFAVYALSPYNINYSINMWKDVVFSAACLIFVTSFYRILKHLGRKPVLNYILFALGGICMGIWRSNGWLASLAAFALCFLFLKKKHKKALLLWAMALLVSWAMKGPVLSALNVPQPDIVESLSIPIQQVARVVYDGCELSGRDAEMIDAVVDIDEIPELYLSYLSDPMKDEIRSKGSSHLKENLFEYLKLWGRLGLEYPGEYLKAWIDQTKGYWNGGYYYGVTANPNHNMFTNELGLHKTVQDSAFGQWFCDIFYSLETTPVLEICYSIGFHVWVLAFLLVCCLLQKRPECMLGLPILMVILTLLVATPVAFEFRYAYSVFTTLPLILPVSLYRVPEKEET